MIFIHTSAMLRLYIYAYFIYSIYIQLFTVYVKDTSEHTNKCIIYNHLIVCYDDGTHFCANGHAHFDSTMIMHLTVKVCVSIRISFPLKKCETQLIFASMGVLGSEKFTTNI